MKKKYTVKDISEIDNIVFKVIVDHAKEQGMKFTELIKAQIENEFLSSLGAHEVFPENSGDLTSDSKAQEVVDAIRNATITKSFKNGVLHYSLTIPNNTESLKKGLLLALNDGTGIYNKEHPHMITPKKGKYMFIPGYKFSRSLFRNLTHPKSSDGRRTYSRANVNEIIKRYRRPRVLK